MCIYIRIISTIIIITSSSDPHHDILSSIYSDMFLTFYLACIFWHSFWHSIRHSIWYISSHILSDILCDILHSQLRSRSAHWALALAVEVGQRPLTSGARCWGPAVPTEIWSLQLTQKGRPRRRGSRRRQAEAGGGGQHFWKNLGTWQVGNYWWFIPSNQD